MTRTTVDRYLRELDRELQDLPTARRRELLDEIREHIDSALEASPLRDEAEVRNVLDRLGRPVEIAEEARRRFGISRATPGIRETLVLFLLPIGGVIVPILGWAVGAFLLVGSRVWTTREKVIGMLVWPGGLLPAFLLMLLPGQVCSSFETAQGVVERCEGGIAPVLAWALLAILVAGPVWTVWFLANRRRGVD